MMILNRKPILLELVSAFLAENKTKLLENLLFSWAVALPLDDSLRP